MSRSCFTALCTRRILFHFRQPPHCQRATYNSVLIHQVSPLTRTVKKRTCAKIWIDHFIVTGDRHKGDYVMTIRSWAGAGAVALASALVCGWSAGPAMAKCRQRASQRQLPTLSYPLSLRGNAGDYSIRLR